MALSETALTIILVIAIFILMILNVYIRGRRVLKTPLGKVASILGNVNHNAKLVENFSFHRGAGRMKTAAWTKNKDKVDVLSQALRTELSQLFEMCEEVNDRINSARKFKSDSYMAGIDVSKLKEPLAKSKQQLQDWLEANMHNPAYQPKRRRGIFGF